MPGLVPGIHVFPASIEDVDGRNKSGHDGILLSRLRYGLPGFFRALAVVGIEELLA
jgi:hypothetical protein